MLIDAEEAFDKIEHWFIKKRLSRPGIEGNLTLKRAATNT